MSDVNGPNFSVNQVNYGNNNIQKHENTPEITEKEVPQLNDFSDPKAEALGRSMLIKDADNINNDIKALIENPQIAENSDELFETSYKAAQSAGLEHPYEAAASFSTGVIQ